MGGASRQRRLNRERQRQRAGHAAGTPQPAGPAAGQPDPGQPQPELSLRELAELGVVEAVRVVCAGQADAYGSHLDRLAIERTPGWTRMVSAVLVDYLRRSVTSAWQGGWQPAELARHIGRQLSAAHAALIGDMITAEMSGYAAAAVDARWAAQTAVIESEAPGPGAWWGSDADYLAARYALGQDAEFIGTVSVAVDTLHAFRHLPAIERLLPLPGRARAARPGRVRPADERMLGRIRALLAKAEATEFTEEAEALSARAQELMAKYRIDHALLAAESGDDEDTGARRIAVDNPYEAAKATLLQTVAVANRCRTVWSREIGLVTTIGFPADLDAVELLFTSLLVQADTAMVRAGGKRDSGGRSRTRAFRQSFLVSYSIRIGERLTEAAGHAEQEAVAQQRAAAGAGTDLVPFLAAREQAVDDAVNEMFGRTLTRARSVRATDAEGWTSGRAAADLASLSGRAPVTGEGG